MTVTLADVQQRLRDYHVAEEEGWEFFGGQFNVEDIEFLASEAEDKQRLLGVLRDVWVQYSLDRRKGGQIVGRWAGGLSVLGDVEHELRLAQVIDADGWERDDNVGLSSGELTA